MNNLEFTIQVHLIFLQPFLKQALSHFNSHTLFIGFRDISDITQNQSPGVLPLKKCFYPKLTGKNLCHSLLLRIV